MFFGFAALAPGSGLVPVNGDLFFMAYTICGDEEDGKDGDEDSDDCSSSSNNNSDDDD